jgi:hypothetical protein
MRSQALRTHWKCIIDSKQCGGVRFAGSGMFVGIQSFRWLLKRRAINGISLCVMTRPFWLHVVMYGSTLKQVGSKNPFIWIKGADLSAIHCRYRGNSCRPANPPGFCPDRKRTQCNWCSGNTLTVCYVLEKL